MSRSREQTRLEAREAFFQPVDVADQDSVEAMYAAAAERYGGIDVLYNNAGIMPADGLSILDTEADAWQRVRDVNTKEASSSAASTGSPTCSSAGAAR